MLTEWCSRLRRLGSRLHEVEYRRIPRSVCFDVGKMADRRYGHQVGVWQMVKVCVESLRHRDGKAHILLSVQYEHWYCQFGETRSVIGMLNAV